MKATYPLEVILIMIYTKKVGKLAYFFIKAFVMYYEYLIASIQIISEALPISSSTHVLWLMMLLEKYHRSIPAICYTKAYEFIMHIPTVMVICVYFLPRIVTHLFYLPVSTIKQYVFFILCSNSITVMLYPFMKSGISNYISPWFGLGITSLLLLISPFFTGSRTNMTMVDASIIGFAQGCALLPGISRLAVTLVIAQARGLSPQISFIYTCLLQLPLFGAAGLYGLWCFKDAPFSYSFFGIVMISLAMLLALGAMYIVERCTRERKLWYFGIYVIFVMVLARIFI